MIIRISTNHVNSVRTWLSENVGPEVKSSGSNFKGLGWTIWFPTSVDTNDVLCIVGEIELTNDVDAETQMLAALRWNGYVN